MSVQTIHFNDTFITNEPLKIELIDIAESSDLTEKLLNVLLDVYNEKGSFAYHGETTHIVALYDNGEVVGGALLTLQFVMNRYRGTEIHSSPKDNAVNLFTSNGFVVSRRRGCLCKIRKELTHLVWNHLTTTLRDTSKIPAFIDS